MTAPEAQNPFNTPAEQKELPPPPPEKSTHRQQSAMGNQSSTARSPRKDSLHSQDGKEDMEPVRRKPLPLPKFTSLADLGNGPRGGKGGPLPQPRARKQSLEDTENDRGRTMVRNDGAETVPRENAPPKLRDQPTPMAAPRIVNPLPPTPKDEPIAAPPTSSKKPFGGMGLPSNPKHKKGKSDTGFDVLKSATSPQQQQLPTLPQTITPGPTPSPHKTEKMRNEGIVDQTGLSPEVQNSQRRPFSFEPVPTSSPQLKEPAEEPYPTASINASPAQQPSPSVPPTTTPKPSFPPRSASRLPPPPAFASLPSQQRSSANEITSMSEEESSPPSTPFVPLTQAPTHVPNPPITERHHACYSRHATFVWSKNSFQPMACMICANNDAERRWACVWCYLRICVDCSEELQRTPGRNLARVLESREKEVSKRAAEARYAGEEYEEEGGMHPGFETGGDAKGMVNGKRHDSGNANPSFVVWDADAEDVGERVDFS
ncbi:hypothetical protein SLS60_000001 [Paraconiothyrium brasiliense]|uniref:B box-type domain-containing protein n=1 Tax=Paraconiothyrium brasiliense TaxID=300254 RepID=A0ABR3S508_9PLEO